MTVLLRRKVSTPAVIASIHKYPNFPAVLNNTRSGSVAINDVIIQNSVNDTPFHGVGESGCKF